MEHRSAKEMELQEDFYEVTKYGFTHDIWGCTVCISHHGKKVRGPISYRCGRKCIV